ncbi:hypothetical protein MASR2M39_09900 [Ignavibacteriales bacterium]
MNWIDIVVILLTGASFYLGYKEGFIKKVFDIVGFFLGIFLAIKFAGAVGGVYKSVLGVADGSAGIIGGVTIFIFFQILTAIIVKATKIHDKVDHLLNKIVGGFIGAIQVVVFLSAILFFASKLAFPSEITTKNSILYNSVVRVLPGIVDLIIPSGTPGSLKKGSIDKELIKEK